MLVLQAQKKWPNKLIQNCVMTQRTAAIAEIIKEVLQGLENLIIHYFSDLKNYFWDNTPCYNSDKHKTQYVMQIGIDG